MISTEPQKRAVKQSVFTRTLNMTSIVLIAFSFVAVLCIINSDQRVNVANQAHYDLTQSAKHFMDASAYLTNEVRAYAATGNTLHYDNYWREVRTDRNRDIAVNHMRAIGITEEEAAYVDLMFALSNNLIPLEDEAMVSAANGNTEAALDAVYGTEYAEWITLIHTAQTEFIMALGDRTERELALEHADAQKWLMIMVTCLLVTAAIQIISTSFVRRKLINPLLLVRDEMAKFEHGDLRSEFSAKPDTSEMGMLIASLQKTKAELNSYIADITEKLAVIAEGDDEARIDAPYPGDFNKIKISINTISQILAQQRARDIESRRALEEALDDAHHANSAKSSFLSNMSHEMRTPLNAILGMTNIALSSRDPEKQLYCLEKINDASIHLLGVINDILDMSKIDANKFDLSPTDCNFEKMLIRVVDIISFRIKEKKQNFRVRIDTDVPPVIIADDQRLAQVITNLLSNAVKFTPEQGIISVDIRLVEIRNGMCKIYVAVQDSGIGISQEQQAKLFSSFTQADASISRKFGGTGLGLVISKSIIEKMGGRIWVESEEGNGSLFAFEFTAEIGDEDADATARLNSINWPELNVLIADSDSYTQEYFQAIAGHYGFQCHGVTDGVAAVETLASGTKYDVYFIDRDLPQIDGIELTHRVREKFGADTIVIMTSASAWDDIETDTRNAGIDSFVSKPLFMSVLIDNIAEALGVKSQPQPGNHQNELPDFSRFHILLAEDIDINREIVTTLLEPTNVTITCAENGQIALDLYSADPELYDLIFMDMHMPEMDGSTATIRIRELENERAKTVPIVAMTANVFREDVERYLSIGMNDHIGKPLDFNVVLDVMRKYLY